MFTKRYLESLQPTGKSYTVKDDKTHGLILMVTPGGAKTFYSYRWLNGKPERFKLGTFPGMTIEQARRRADDVNGAIANNGNPAAVKRSLKAEPTLLETFERFITEKRNRSGKPLTPRTIENYQALLTHQLADLAKLKLSQVTPARLRALKIPSDAQHNKAKALISSVFTWAAHEGITEAPNPAAAMKTRFIKSRERFLQPAELPGFLAAVEASPMRDFFLLALLTGARRSNLQSMAWADLDLEQGTWRIPKTKNGEALTLPLVGPALDILAERQKAAIPGAVYVFPGPGKSGHLMEPKKAWAAILQAAGLESLRIHDLRRTLGSWQARAGASLPIIGKSLGHKSQQATAIYARLDLDPVRTSVEQATAALLEAGKAPSGPTPTPTPPAETVTRPDAPPEAAADPDTGGNVVPFRRRA
ncbi:MAG: tyrosine-type recombinase/integrase [Methylococcus sp.]